MAVNKEVMDVEAAAKYLGAAPRTIRELLHDGKLPGSKIGRGWRVSKKALDEHLAQRNGAKP